MSLNDKSPMPFGKHQGVAMANVQASYLLWLYENNKCSKEVKDYIEENMDLIQSEIKTNNK